MDLGWTRAAGTGHRELEAGDAGWVAEKLPKAAVWLRDEAGTQVGVSGLALGFDMDWAEAVLDAGLHLWVAIPFEEQAARWPRKQQARWAKLRAAATRERVVGRVPADLPPRNRSAAVNALLFRRNSTMLDVASAVLTVWEPGRFGGGTAGALLDAANRRLPGVHLDPVNRTVRTQLPTREQLEPFALYRTVCGHVARIGTRPGMQVLLGALAEVGHRDWRVRPARPRETFDDGCDDCIVELVASTTVNVNLAA